MLKECYLISNGPSLSIFLRFFLKIIFGSRVKEKNKIGLNVEDLERKKGLREVRHGHYSSNYITDIITDIIEF